MLVPQFIKYDKIYSSDHSSELTEVEEKTGVERH